MSRRVHPLLISPSSALRPSGIFPGVTSRSGKFDFSGLIGLQHGFNQKEPVGYFELIGRGTGHCAGIHMPRCQLLRGGDNCGIVAEAGEPVDEGFFAKPGELALGVAARGLGNGFGGGGEGNGAFEMSMQFAVADEVKGL